METVQKATVEMLSAPETIFISEIPPRGIAVVGDIHFAVLPRIGWSNIGVQSVERFSRLFQADIIVLNGDTFDLTIQPDLQSIVKHVKDVFYLFEREILQGSLKRVIILGGNHDPLDLIAHLKATFWFLEVGENVVIGNDYLRIEHGHQIVAAPIGEDRLLEVRVRLGSGGVLHQMLGKLTGQMLQRRYGIPAMIGNLYIGQAITDSRLPLRLKARMVSVNQPLIEDAAGRPYTWNIFGHTHSRMLDLVAGVANPGSFSATPGMKNKFFAVYIYPNGEVDLVEY
ncbi:MAG: metallophosphoesterase [Patescibacteria group bacterium]|nr:metallophosphoesterase [Patescibacteria group bacterium]